MSTQRKQILEVLSRDTTRAWSYSDLYEALPEIKPNVIRSQVSRLIKSGDVARSEDASLRSVIATDSQQSATALATSPGTSGNASDTLATATPNLAKNSPKSPAVARSLFEHPSYSRVLEALPISSLRSAFKLATALAFTRSELEGCESPALACCGLPGTGKTMLFKALSTLLHGDSDSVIDARNLTSKQQVIGRRQQVDGAYTATPSVLLEPPDRERPKLICLDEIADASSNGVLEGASLLLRLEDSYFLEGVKMPMRALLGLTWNKKGKSGMYHPWLGWDGATRRMLICDLDYAASALKSGAAKTAARQIHSVLEDSQLVDFERYRSRAAYPPTALLESADVVLGEIFLDPSELPVSDPVLRGLTAAYSALFELSPERALLAAIADVATVVGTLPNRLTPTAEKRLNARLSAAGLSPISLPKVSEPDLTEETEGLGLTPQQRQRIASHLASASVKSTNELLTVLCEYKLACKVWRPIRLPRFLLEALGRWLIALAFGVLTILWNLASKALKMPRIAPAIVASVFGLAWYGPATKLSEFVDKDGQPLRAPRDYVIKLFGDDMSARNFVTLEDASRESEKGLADAA